MSDAQERALASVAKWNTPVEGLASRARKSVGLPPPGEPGDPDEFPEEAWKAWIHEMAKVKHVEPVGWMKRSARWGYARRSEEHATQISFERADREMAARLCIDWSKKCAEVEAARDAAQERIAELEESRGWNTVVATKKELVARATAVRAIKAENERMHARLKEAVTERDALKAENDRLRSFGRGWEEIERALGRSEEERASVDLAHYVPILKAEVFAARERMEEMSLLLNADRGRAALQAENNKHLGARAILGDAARKAQAESARLRKALELVIYEHLETTEGRGVYCTLEAKQLSYVRAALKGEGEPNA